MKKGFCVLVVAIVAFVTVVGCAAPAPSPTAPTASKPAIAPNLTSAPSSAAVAPAPAPTSATAPAPTAGSTPATSAKLSGTIKLGINSDDTGLGASFGIPAKRGVEMAADDINKSGLLGDAKIELVSYDNATDKNQAITIVRRLAAQDNVVAILGPVMANSVAAAGPVANELGVPLLTVTGVTGLEGKDDYIFQTHYTTAAGIAAAEAMVQRLGRKKPVALFDKANVGFVAVKADLEKRMNELGVKLLGQETVVPTDSDLSAALTSLKKFDPDTLLCYMTPAQSGNAIVQASEAGWKDVLWVGASNWDAKVIFSVAGPYVDGTKGTGVFGAAWAPNPNQANSLAFSQKYQAKYGEQPLWSAALSYQGIVMVANAMKTAGTTDRKAVRDALAKMTKFDGGPVEGFTMNETGEARYQGQMMTFEKGKGNAVPLK